MVRSASSTRCLVLVVEVTLPCLEGRFVCEGDDAAAGGERTHVEVCIPGYVRVAVTGGDVAARVEGNVLVVRLSVSDAACVSVSGFVAEGVFASREAVAASVVSVLIEVNLCGADVRRVNGDEVGGNVLAFEQVASVPIIEANGGCGGGADVEVGF